MDIEVIFMLIVIQTHLIRISICSYFENHKVFSYTNSYIGMIWTNRWWRIWSHYTNL